MKTVIPVVLGATCIGLYVASNHQVDGFLGVVASGASGRKSQLRRAISPASVERSSSSRREALEQRRSTCGTTTCRMMGAGFGQQSDGAGASGKASAKTGKGKKAAKGGGGATEGAADKKGTGQRQLFMQFTCNQCEGVSQYMINKNAYEDGIVICTCQKCQVRHLIADNLKKMDFPAFGDNIEEYMQSTGTPEEVTKGRAPDLTPDIVEKYHVAMGKDGVLTLSPKEGGDMENGTSSAEA